MTLPDNEFDEAERELDRIENDPSILEEEYTEVTEEQNHVPDQLIWRYIYKNISGSLRKALREEPPESFPKWLRELFAKEYPEDDDALPPDEFINKALEYLVRRRMTA